MPTALKIHQTRIIEMNKKLIELIRQEFYKRISRKTGWGYREVKEEFEKAIADACSIMLDEK